MRRWTTPTLTLRCKGIDLTACDVWVTFEQSIGAQRCERVTSTVKGEDMALDGTDTLVDVTMTQEQSARFVAGHASVQVNWLDGEDKRGASEIATLKIDRNLLERVVTDAE